VPFESIVGDTDKTIMATLRRAVYRCVISALAVNRPER